MDSSNSNQTDRPASPSPRQMLFSFSQAGIGSALTLVVLALLNKVLAVLGGPNTVGLFSILRQAEYTGIALASSDGDKALVQGISARRGDPTAARYVWNIGALMAAITLAEGAALWIAAPWVSLALFNEASPALVWAVRLVSLPILLAVASTWLIAILKSHLAVGKAVLVRTIGGTAGILVAILVARQGGPVALVGLLLATEAVGVVAGWAFTRSVKALPPRPAWSWQNARSDGRAYLSVAGYLLLTGVLRNLTVLVLRTAFLRGQGLAYAGFFEAAWTVAGKSLLFLLDAIGTYYLPLLSAARHSDDRPVLLRRLTRLAWAAAAPAVIGLVVLRPLAIELLYSSEFLQALDMLQWMIIGIYFQASAWPFSTAMLAFGDVRSVFRVDAGWLAIFLTGGLISLTVLQRPAGVGVAYLAASVVMLTATAAVAVRRYALQLQARVLITWSLGLLAVLGATWSTWGETAVDWPQAVLWVAVAGVIGLLTLHRSERRAILDFIRRTKG